MTKEEVFSGIEKEVERLSGEIVDFRRENDYLPVIGEGSLDAEVMFVGEAPGESEAKTGKPFCGRSGKVLDELLVSINLDRVQVYVTNIVKDRPPKNRDPKAAEIDIYAKFLDRQITTIQPKVIVTLGRFSMAYLLKRYGAKESGNQISELHGKLCAVTIEGNRTIVLPLYHPAVALYNPSMRVVLQKDIRILIKYIK